MEFAQRLIATRRGSTILGIAAAALAGVIVLVYLNQYRNSVKSSAAPVTVLVAKRVIQQGTTGDVVASSGWFQTSSIPKDQLQQGALTDVSSLRGQVATTDIYPGQQLTIGEFVPAAQQILTKLKPNDRAVAVPVDSAHGLVGQIVSGDHVDIYAGFTVMRGSAGGTIPVIKLLMSNALVLQAPKKSTTGLASTAVNVIVRASAADAAEIAFAADNGKLWLVLRPANSKSTPPSLVTAQTLLLGVSPVIADRQVRAAGGTK
jgi:pilus assembly protein CpaB